MKSNQVLLPQEPQSIDSIRPSVACDIETLGLGGEYIIGGLKTESGATSYYRNAGDLVKAFLTRSNRNSEMIIHNADYDMRYILPYLMGYETHISVNGSGRIIHCKVTNNKDTWYIRDTYALMPEKLAKLAGLAGMPKLDIGLASGVTFDADNSEHMEYLERDIVMLSKAYTGYCNNLYDTYQIGPARTAGSTAVRAFRRTMKAPYFRQRTEIENLARNGYYGGLTFLRTINPMANTIKIDANAMYAASMRRYGVPVRAGSYTTKEVAHRPGIYNCRVHAGDNVTFTFVPYRNKNNILWPKGKYNTVLPSITIDLARRYGYEIEVIDGYYFDGIEYIFDDFINGCETLERQQKERNTGAYIVYKILRNSLYGKFAQRAENKSYHLTEIPPETAFPVIDNSGKFVPNLWQETNSQEYGYFMPLWAAWITAGARAILTEMVYNLGPENVCYGDTDSIVVSTDALANSDITFGNMYGEWKIEKGYRVFQALAPKLYYGITDDNEIELKHKGIPIGNISLEDMQKITKETPLKVEFIRLNKAIKTLYKDSTVLQSRTVRNVETSDRWVVLENGIVVPVTIWE